MSPSAIAGGVWREVPLCSSGVVWAGSDNPRAELVRSDAEGRARTRVGAKRPPVGEFGRCPAVPGRGLISFALAVFVLHPAYRTGKPHGWRRPSPIHLQ